MNETRKGGQKPMRKFMYETVIIAPGEMKDALNNWGDHGWRLVCTRDHPQGIQLFFELEIRGGNQ